ncbi:unnamed protein product [Oikopleura dioica]|uniref:Kringle domain-containing protein n=1 Tax=Oikopleura dioica TaxID=34765 RepID=E4Y3W8_OIKDI|nr:unnamed protein product [Oikopleura dioica]
MPGLTLLQTGCIQIYDERGRNYVGFKQTTVSGLTCQKWNSQTPHSHSREKDNYGEKDFETNFCRNPDNEPGGPWCYTTDPDSRWEYCGIPNCEETTATITSSDERELSEGECALAFHFSAFLEHLQGQQRQQEEQRREQLLDLRLALIIPVILGNAPAGRHMDTAEHIAEIRWNTIVAELVDFARPMAVDR